MCFICRNKNQSIQAKLDKEINRQADEHDRYHFRGKYAEPNEEGYESDESDASLDVPAIEIGGCSKLIEVPSMGADYYGIEYMCFGNCPNLTTIHASKGVSMLNVYNCPNLTTIYSSDGMYGSLIIGKCPKLTTIHPADNLQSIELDDCPSLLIEQVPVDCVKPSDTLFPKAMKVTRKYRNISTATEDGPPMVYRLISNE